MITEFHIGLDDTDSRHGGCTSYTAALLFDRLCEAGITPRDFPWLVRLNPNVPWKTRGNGALAIHLLVSEEEIPKVKQIALKTVDDASDTSQSGTDPAVVFLRGPVPRILGDYYVKALHDILTVEEASKVAKIVGSEIHLIRGTRGMIGSLAALGARLGESEHTFEIIAYRSKANLGKPRKIDRDSVFRMNFEHGDRTFHNVDPETERILICPHGPDPVLLGIRGQSPQAVLEAFNQVRIREHVERKMIFRTNQGTDAHIGLERSISNLRPYQSTIVSGRVETMPQVLKGGHVVFRVGDGTGLVDCLAFEPAGSMARIARELLPGDRVIVSGGVRSRDQGPFSLNLEKIEIVQLEVAFREQNPACPTCGGRCESMGRNQGFRCKKCRFRIGRIAKNRTILKRNIAGLTYIPPSRSRRHLTKPDDYRCQEIPKGTKMDNSSKASLEILWNTPSVVDIPPTENFVVVGDSPSASSVFTHTKIHRVDQTYGPIQHTGLSHRMSHHRLQTDSHLAWLIVQEFLESLLKVNEFDSPL